MEVLLIDGIYEPFRHFYALPRAKDREGQEVAAVRGVLGSVLGMIQAGATHIGVATDHMTQRRLPHKPCARTLTLQHRRDGKLNFEIF